MASIDTMVPPRTSPSGTGAETAALQTPPGAPDQLDLGGTDIKRDDISGHRQYLTFRTDSDRRR